jgi:hypothetical protein
MRCVTNYAKLIMSNFQHFKEMKIYVSILKK